VPSADAIIMTAAVADYRPSHQSITKIKKRDGESGLTVELDRNPDIIGSLRDASLVRIGFAAETNDHIIYGADKLNKKNLDLVVVNDAVDTIGSANSAATIISRSEEPLILPKMVKERLASVIVARLPQMLADQ
jgi:phosphopantothenoylcysteine decarboxylase / phosphopantothenate---cysteine ligase